MQEAGLVTGDIQWKDMMAKKWKDISPSGLVNESLARQGIMNESNSFQWQKNY